MVSSNTPGPYTPKRTVIYTWLFPWKQISPNKIPFMFLFLIYHGILPVPINNYSNAIEVTKWWTLGLCTNTIIRVLYHWASPYTRNVWWCTVDCGWVYHKSDNIYKNIVVWLLNSRMEEKKHDHHEKRYVVQTNSNCIKRYRWKRIKRHKICCISAYIWF